MQVITIATPSLGDRSHVVHDGTVAAVIDPQRDIDRVLEVIEREGLTIVAVAETHIHNDYVSGGLALAQQSGAKYLVAAQDQVDFERVPVEDGQVFEIGDFTLRAVHTPGHTQTHLSWVAVEDGQDRAVFTGGSMLFGSVGRTDLLPDADPEEMTRSQYRSVRGLADDLPGDAGVHPTHGFGSFCSSGDTVERDESTIAIEREDNDALVNDDEDAFVADLLAGLDAYPAYYRHMAPRNLDGAKAPNLSPIPQADAAEVDDRIARGEWVVDLRPRAKHAASHVPGTISVEYGDQATTYLGWTIPWGMPLTLVADDLDVVHAMQRDLVRIGIERPVAHAVGLVDRAERTETTRVVDFAALAAARSDEDGPFVLDTRLTGEWSDGHIRGAMHIPLHELVDRIDEVPEDREVWVHCASGYRASIATSLLRRAGRDAVLIDDDVEKAPDVT